MNQTQRPLERQTHELEERYMSDNRIERLTPIHRRAMRSNALNDRSVERTDQ